MKRTNYSLVYITRKDEEGFTLWNSEPHREGRNKKGEWLDSHNRRPMLGDTMPLVEAQLYGACHIEHDDVSATPAIIVPLEMLSEYSETADTHVTNDIVSFSSDSNVVSMLTPYIPKIDKAGSQLYDVVVKVKNSAKEIPTIITKADNYLVDHFRMLDTMEQCAEELTRICKEAKELSTAKKHKDIKDDTKVDKKTFSDKIKSFINRNMKDMLVEMRAILEDYKKSSDEEMKSLYAISDDLGGRINIAENTAQDLSKLYKAMISKVQSRPLGDAVKVLYQRIDILNDSLNAQIARNTTLRNECASLENQNTLLANEAINLRKGMAEWIKEEMPDTYRKILNFGFYMDQVKKVNIRNTVESREIKAALDRSYKVLTELEKRDKLDKIELADVSRQTQIVDKMIRRLLSRSIQEERQEFISEQANTNVETNKEAQSAAAESQGQSKTNKEPDTEQKTKETSKNPSSGHSENNNEEVTQNNEKAE